uniref:Uncharacterized protein n=1 Tax=Timema bartmani TaxID=61472 RepID=A0A7R9EU53_9NEOP|nr:unnamed protein product [Timema bartmani]
MKSQCSGSRGDEVQRSLELLDRVLSEFDDLENGNLSGEVAVPVPAPTPPPASSSTPDDESPSLGHQSEDDGYMSMNGRRAKFALSFRPVPDEELPPAPDPPPEPPPAPDMVDFPPPPEEAQRIISTLLPRVSPGNSAKRSSVRRGHELLNSLNVDGGKTQSEGRRVTTATQTTLPKTRHQRPYGWQTGTNQPPFHLQDPPPPQLRFASLPYDGALKLSRFPPPWLPPRTVPSAVERHREVRRRGSGDSDSAGGCGGEEPCPPLRTLDELTDFSDDSLEELLPPPPSITSKRNSIAWEVPLGPEDADPLLTPGSTKVVGRRRHRSTDHSSTSSIHRLRDQEEWPDPPASTEDETFSPLSDSYYDSSATNDQDDHNYNQLGIHSKEMTPNGTYVIRKGRKKERKPLPPSDIPQYHPNFRRLGDLKRCSSTFDNIKSLLKEGFLEGLNEAPADFLPPPPPTMIRGVSLPTLASSDCSHRDRLEFSSVSCGKDNHLRSKNDVHRVSRPHELAITVEEEEDLSYPYGIEKCNGIDSQFSDLRVSEEERKLIAQLERENSGQFLDTSAESLLLGDRDFLYHKRRSSSSDSAKMSTKRSLSERKDSFEYNHRNHESIFNDDSLESGHITDSLNTHPNDIGHITNGTCHYSTHKTDDRLTESQEALLENVIQDSNFKKRPDCLRSRSEEYAKTVDVDDVWLLAAELKHFQIVPVVEGIDRDRIPDEFKVAVEILQHEFPPLPPSPVEEDDDEYSEILHPSPVQTPRGKADTLPEPFYRSLEPPSCDLNGSQFINRPCPPEPPPHHEPTSSLKTRSMDAGFSRGHRNHNYSSRREIPSERRTLPSELPGPLRRRTFQKRTAQSPQTETLQTSCSLPETPIFARGCDIPRTPHRRAPDIPSMARTAPRPGGLSTSGYRRVGTGPLGQALVGAELLRLAGGPGRGWYPRHRQPRPASIEHLDRLTVGHSPGHSNPSPWEARDARKPLTLPPNLSPKFFHRSPREALRRVTSLLIRKDSNLDFLVIGGLIYCKNSTLDYAATKADFFVAMGGGFYLRLPNRKT